MAFNNYGYGGYPGYYPPPMQDQLAQLRSNPMMQPNMQGQPMQQPMQNTQPVQQPVMQQPVQASQPANLSGPVYVNGEAGARGFIVSAGNTVMLIDADPDANTFWLKSADASGMPSMRTFDYTERVNVPRAAQTASQVAQSPGPDYVPRKDFEELAARTSDLERELETLKAKKATTTKKPAKEDDE